MFLTITLLATALTFIYVYLTWYHSYWTKRGVPGPTPVLLLGNFPSFILRNRPFVEEFQAIYDKYRARANFAGVFNGRQPAVLLQNATFVKDVLIKNFKNFQDNEFADSINKENDPIFGRNPFMLKGEEWKEKRAEVTPAFTTSRMKALFPFVEDVSQRMKQYIDRNTNQPIETREMCAKFTTDVVSSCIFAADAQSFTKEKAEIREMGRKLTDPSFRVVLIFLLIGIVPALKKLIPIAFVPKSVERFFTKLMEDAVEYRQKNHVKRSDYLEHLINLKAKKQISSLDMAAHAVTFFIDGFETSSLAMSFALYELARNQAVQEKLRGELLQARNDDGSIEYDTLLELPYLDQVLSESLRLWPPAAFLSKVCTVPTEMELFHGKTVSIEQGMPVMIPVWCLHRDPEYYNDPECFNPDRFAPEAGGTKLYREKGCYLPFGDGPRQCLGMRFALMQVKRGLFEVVTRYELFVNSKTLQPLKLDPKTFITAPLNGCWLDYKPKRIAVKPLKMILTITLLATALTFIYVYLTWYHSYWTKRGVPGPPPMLLFGNFPSFILRHRPFVEEFQKIYDHYRSGGNFVGVFSALKPTILVLHPSLIKDVLTKNFRNFGDNEFADSFNKETDPIFGRNPFVLKGEEWKQKRAEITPAFTSSRIKALFPLVADVSQRMKQYIDRNPKQPIETREMCARFTTDVVSSCIFATDAQSFTKENAEIREMGRKLLEPSMKTVVMFVLMGLVPALKKLIQIAFVPKPVEQFFTKLMEDAVQYREKHNVQRSDYLEYLINLKDKKQISSLDMAAHGVTFFIDGFETSSLAMSFALYELARNQAVQEKLRAELLQARNDDGSIEYDTLLELPYLDQVFNESLRLWPPGSFLWKVCTVPTEIELHAGKMVPIEQGMPVMMPLWCIHRDPKYFDDPECFFPDRFAPETGGTKVYREKGCFLPFSEGPRQCLGMRFALMQVKRGLFEVVTRYELSVNAKTQQPLKLDPKHFILCPLNGFWLDYKPIPRTTEL
ncbi:uncharacterized protein LOC131207219 [Anopheles bellator]|uniref:uncharacterized protein LOC131207219 n=1 Tax=Anopheles bellator TaxID=139047 RepID=UPI002648DDAF|nr:uncharacterized protein LOC131207219 [Anopheles bellator]